MATWNDARDKAISLGAKTISTGMNWTWANGFPNPEAGMAFVAWLEANGMEHRGYYRNNPESDDDVDGVRFR